MKKFIEFILLPLSILLSSCSSEITHATCNISFKLKNINDQEVYEFFIQLAKNHNLETTGYDRNFSSGASILIVQAKRKESPIFTLLNDIQKGNCVISIYDDQSYLKKLTKHIKENWEENMVEMNTECNEE